MSEGTINIKIKNVITGKCVGKDYISKDKIKEKIKELENEKYVLSSRQAEIELLKELLEE